MVEKLLSRKLWLAVLAIVLVVLGIPAESETGEMIKAAVVALLAVAYQIMQGRVDVEKARANGIEKGAANAKPARKKP